ncbi:DUF222 domain-containing protein [Mycobacterium sp. Lab-001]|uniref:HNH endonuclease signature motif containing protein n=1 Tax=Mycobacterium sp. Lab-001 TaxID=3410136 RepID=UPI003D176BE3
MCDTRVSEAASLRAADDAVVVDAIGAATRAEAVAAARRLAAVAEFVSRHAGGDTTRAHWSCDNWDALAAEVAAVQGISHAMASGQMYLGMALRERLPKVGALFADGLIGARLASTIVWHTDLIKDPEILALVDATLAADAARFGPMSVSKTAQAIDAVVDRHDPAALRRIRAGARGRDVVITPPEDQSGIANLWGAMFATDAAVLERRLSQLAHGVCADDPRTVAQRRADALGALAAGAERLACDCGNDQCPAAGPDARATAVVIHVLADAAALDTPPDPHLSGEVAPPSLTAQTTLAEALAQDPEPDVPAGPRPPAALIAGGAVLPAPVLAELIRRGAQVRPVRHPGDGPPEPGYRPSAALQRFIRCRDLTCRFPGCDRPAEFTEIDHTIPYPLGPTHPSNLKCLCTKHHLLKTFWTGWRDRQHPDGVIVWTSPSEREYITRPGSRLLFPALSLPTAELTSAATTLRHTGNRSIMMPTRRRTRKQDRARRIDAERALNAAHVAQRNQPPPY